METHGVLTVPVEVACEWLVARVTEQERVLRGAETANVRVDLIDDAERLARRPVNRDRVTFVV
jgi:hypothetical protein